MFSQSFLAVDKKCQEESNEIEAVKNHVDLSPVCSMLGTENDATAGVHAAVEKWINLLNEKLVAAVQLVVEYEVDENQEGVPSMAGIMQDDVLYVQYLKHWEAGGTFEQLIVKANEAMAALAETHQEAMEA